jgi:hypothetical protein
MKKTARRYLDTGLKSKGYNLDFEAKSGINSRFECSIFSDGERVVVIIGESVRSKTGGITKMLYRYHSCKVGDDGDLRKFIESEILMKNPSLLTGEYGEIVCRLIDKIRSYGTRSADSTDYGGEVIRCPKSSYVSYLSDYRETVSSGKGRRFCHTN